MIKRICMFFAKKYAISIINDALASLQEKKDMTPYREKIKAVANCASDLMTALDDNSLDSDELEALTERVKDLFN